MKIMSHGKNSDWSCIVMTDSVNLTHMGSSVMIYLPQIVIRVSDFHSEITGTGLRTCAAYVLSPTA